MAPNGLVVFSGPMGSGKTTVLLSALHERIDPENVVFSIEDPVEYRLPGVTQISINRRAGIDFPEALSAVMRSDPDVVMVGELAGPEALDGCLQLALTGHLVMTSVYADEAASAVARLMDTGIPPYTLAAGLRAASCQRVVRTICEACRERAVYPEKTVAAWRKRAEAEGLQWPKKASLSKGRGCEKCQQTGLTFPRILIWEMLVVDESVRRLIAERRPSAEIREAGLKAGMTTMFAHGLARALAGETTVEEVLRALGE